jgi:hypothetical protein
MMLPSPFRRLHNHTFCLEIEIFGFLHALGSHAVLVMVFWIVNYRFCAKDYCDGVVILACEFLCCDMPPPLLLIACCPPSSIRLALLYAYVPSGLLDLVGLYIDTLELPPVLLWKFLV